jgi:AmmeMemoRadiSam system protein B
MSNLKLVALVPHPPIMVQEVGGFEVEKVAMTVKAMNLLGKKITSIMPDTIILVTPHSTYHPSKFSIYTNEKLSGNLAMFGADQVNLNFQNDTDFVKKISEKYPMYEIKDIPLDHGTIVPMSFIKDAGFTGNLVVINYCGLPSEEQFAFGQKIRKVIKSFENKKFIFVASGDMSHRLIPHAPAGFHPDAHVFDDKIKQAIEQGDYDLIENIAFDVRERAGECGYNSLMIALGVLDSKAMKNKVYSYEGPFGVGYMVATL